MDSVYHSSGAAGAEYPGTDSIVADRRAQLEGVVRLGRDWLARCDAADPPRGDVVRMGVLADDLAKGSDQSPAAMTMVRALLCSNCRRLNAAEGKCFGQALERCILLNGVKS